LCFASSSLKLICIACPVNSIGGFASLVAINLSTWHWNRGHD
jgi:hypothetical protein